MHAYTMLTTQANTGASLLLYPSILFGLGCLCYQMINSILESIQRILFVMRMVITSITVKLSINIRLQFYEFMRAQSKLFQTGQFIKG